MHLAGVVPLPAFFKFAPNRNPYRSLGRGPKHEIFGSGDLDLLTSPGPSFSARGCLELVPPLEDSPVPWAATGSGGYSDLYGHCSELRLTKNRRWRARL